ncbi:YveK family protein [Bacillus sp. OK048]|uniref:YveK family protein n=1 Tax=Bacillus sp. OK048 TaxID=1882761 RepID=UPI00088C859A|nr:Wzz/FepE/Etk N-terminal domain-containing protein [Bacillus sp. OK048]SDM77501.1 Capsular polysaccharide biosynthesis protein [Bacillus sp. OK048]
MNSFNQNNSIEKRRAKEINLKDLFQVLKRRFWIIFIFTVLASIAGVFMNQTSTTPLYLTSSRIIIGADAESRKTLQVIIKDSTILDKVVQELNLTQSAEALAGQITVASVESSQVVSISVVDRDPNVAAKIADTTARVFREEVPNIVGQDYVRLLSIAKINPAPINQDNGNKLFIAIFAGIVVGVGLAFLVESLDDKIRSEREIESLFGAPVLGRVSKMNNKNIKKKNNSQLALKIRGETIGFK